jgi:hypothetical protein
VSPTEKWFRPPWATPPAGHANKTRSRFLRNGRERPHELFGRLKAEKTGVAPARFGFFSTVTFGCTAFCIRLSSKKLRALQGEETGEDEGGVCSSYLLHLFAQILTARARRIFLLGWSDPRLTLATEPCAKVGSLQPNSVPFRAHSAHFVIRNFLSFGHLFDPHGEREGDGYGDLCLSCTLHLSDQQKAVTVP